MKQSRKSFVKSLLSISGLGSLGIWKAFGASKASIKKKSGNHFIKADEWDRHFEKTFESISLSQDLQGAIDKCSELAADIDRELIKRWNPKK